MTMLRFRFRLRGWVCAAVSLISCVDDPALTGVPDGSADSDTDTDTDGDTESDLECGPLAPGFEESFGGYWAGCGDIEIMTTGFNGDCSAGLLFVDFDAPVFQMYYNGLDSLERVYEFDGPTSAALTVALGFDLFAGACGEETEIVPEVLRTYNATSGTAVLNLTATSDECSEVSCPALADLELTDVVFIAEDDPCRHRSS